MPTRHFVVFLSFCLLFASSFLLSFPPLTSPHRDEAQSRWQMWEQEYSCEAGVPRVLADEILVCSKQQQGHFHSAAPALCLMILLLLPRFQFGRIVT